MYDIILKNCSIVNENQIKESDIAIKNQRIDLISTSIDSEAREVIDLNGKYVIPGLIDDQVHFREPGLTHKGDIATESKAGLAGGVTSFFEMPNVNPTTTTNENLTKKFELASTRALSNYSFHLGASNTNIEEIKKVDINQASALKVFMGASFGEMLVDDIDALDDIFNYSPLIVVTHCEDQKTVKKNEEIYLKKYGEDLCAEHHHLIRDDQSCYLSSSLAVNLAKKYDLQIIIIPSMRTPINTIEHASSFFDKETIIVKNVDKKAYLSALSISEFLVITCDSTSMISEAALTGKPIYVAQIQSKKDDYRFRQFRKLFTKLNIIRNLEDKLEVWNYEKLDETNRVANIIKKKI